MISVIIPALNDALHLHQTLQSLSRYSDAIEVIVVDGGSTDGIASVWQKYPWVIHRETPPGRARQLNVGAQAAHGDLLLFLHADTQLESGWPAEVQRAADTADFAFGAFRLELAGHRWRYRVIDWAVHARTRFCRLPYGDQAIFVRKKAFHDVGGFADTPLLEDVILVSQLRQRGRFVPVRLRATSSTRNWERDGLVRRTVTNWVTYWRYRSGTPPTQLVNGYQGAKQAVVLFCKEPAPGRVKTRLAATIGDTAAVRLYSELISRTLQTVHACPGEPAALLFVAPPVAAERVGRRFGPGVRSYPQVDGDLGARMLAAFERTFSLGFEHAVIIGTDCPTLAPGHLQRAFRWLRKQDVVLGPTEDGGYYLIGARRPHPRLFTDMPWSSPNVLTETLSRVRAERLRVRLLEKQRDLDTKADLEHHKAMGRLGSLAEEGG